MCSGVGICVLGLDVFRICVRDWCFGLCVGWCSVGVAWVACNDEEEEMKDCDNDDDLVGRR